MSAQRFRYALFAFIHTQTYFEYYTLTLRLASLVKKTVIYAYWTKELFDICRENVSYMATLPSVARHVIHAGEGGEDAVDERYVSIGDKRSISDRFICGLPSIACVKYATMSYFMQPSRVRAYCHRSIDSQFTA